MLLKDYSCLIETVNNNNDIDAQGFERRSRTDEIAFGLA
jgi:hypothetical protein